MVASSLFGGVALGRTTRRVRTGAAMRGLVTLFLVPVMGLALWGSATLGGLYWQLFETRLWMPVPATLVHCELVHPKDDAGAQTGRNRVAAAKEWLLARCPLATRIDAKYLYTFNGVEYTGRRTGLWDTSVLGFGQRHRFVFLSGVAASRRLIPCYINPAAPRDAVLFRTIHWDEFLVLFVPASLAGGIALGAICAYLVVRLMGWTRAAKAYKEWRTQQDYFYGKRPKGHAGYPTYVSTPLCLTLWWYALATPYAAVSFVAVPRHAGGIITGGMALVLGLPLIYWTGMNCSRYDLRRFLRSQGRASAGPPAVAPPAADAGDPPPAPGA